jgi:hypothetical protein
MKPNASPPRKRTQNVIAACIACMTAFAPSLAVAATVPVTFAFNNGAQTTPNSPGSTATTFSPVFTGVQTSTELDTTRSADSTSGVAQPVEATPGASPKQAPKSIPKIGVGIDTLWSEDLKIYAVPLSYTLNRNFSVQLNLPVVTAKFNNETNTGVGDIGLSLKHRIGSENTTVALYSILTAKFATGDENKGLGTGSYDIALTEKIVKRFGGFRGILMGGVTQPLNDPTILGQKVEYGTTISYMAAIEHTIGLPDLWFGVRAQGLHAFESKVAGLAQGDALTTLDVAPEFKFYYKRYTSINLGATIPVVTEYAPLAGSSSTREVSVSFGVSTMF